MTADIVFAASVLPDAFTEVPYLAAIPFYGSTTAITACSVTSGTLPAGLSLNSAYAIISGTIAYNATDGPYSFTISITDSSGTASQAFTMNVHYLEADPDLTAGMLAILREGPPNPGPGLPAALAALAAAEAASLPVPTGTPAADYVPLYVGPSNATEWGAQSGGGGGGAVSSVFGRTGAVTAQTGDYTAAEVGADASGAASAAQAASTSRLARVLVTASGSPYAASANQVISVDTTNGSVIIDLPNGPAAGTLNAVKQVIMGAGYSVTVQCQGSDVLNKASGGTTQTLTLSSQGSLLHYSGTSNGSIWTVLADDLPLGQLETVFAALAGATFTGWTAPAVVTLTDASTVSINAAAGNDFRLLTTSAVGSTRQLGTPSNPVDGQRIDLMVTQPASGGPCTLSYASGYLFSSSLPQPTLSTAAGYTDLLGFIYNAVLGKWLFCGYINGFA
jgi:Putative Ig domain